MPPQYLVTLRSDVEGNAVLLVLLADYLVPLFTQLLLDLFHFFRCLILHPEESCTSGCVVGIRHVKRRQKRASARADLGRSVAYTRRLGACARSHAGDHGVL